MFVIGTSGTPMPSPWRQPVVFGIEMGSLWYVFAILGVILIIVGGPSIIEKEEKRGESGGEERDSERAILPFPSFRCISDIHIYLVLVHPH